MILRGLSFDLILHGEPPAVSRWTWNVISRVGNSYYVVAELDFVPAVKEWRMRPCYPLPFLGEDTWPHPLYLDKSRPTQVPASIQVKVIEKIALCALDALHALELDKK